MPVLTEARSPAPPAPAELAPRWHTAALLALYLAVAGAGLLLTRHGAAPAITQESGPRVAIYLPLIVVQLLLAFYVARFGRPRSALESLVGERWTTARRAGVDLLLAVALCLAIRGLELAWSRLSGDHAPSIAALLPVSAVERLVWAGASIIVGSCEELVFRGYFRIQLGAFTGRAWAAIVLQAAIFGVAHAQQGAASAARIAIYGLLLGLVAQRRRSILPGAVAHIATDLLSGLAR
ncbi:MAG: CPBP family intramembrane glutamic endopeptidase [Byssovorax sp.]